MKTGLIVLDTLRYDTFEAEMPAIRSTADHVFTNCYSTSRWTVPAHGSLFTGLYPTEAGTHSANRTFDVTVPTLAERFTDAGVTTHCLSNNVHIDPFFGFTEGFASITRGPALQDRPEQRDADFDWDALFSRLDDGPLRPVQALKEIVAADAPTLSTLKTGIELFRAPPVNETTNDLTWFLDAVEEIARSPPEDLFLFANLMPTHYPYDPPEEYCDLDPLDVDPLELTLRDDPVTDEEHERHKRNYEGAARYLDDELPAIVDAIDWDVLFVVSDHGELFGEHGIRGHEYGVYDDLVHVPALAVGDAVPEGETDAVTSLLDVRRTLLDVAGIDPGEHTRGRSLFEDRTDDRAVYAESVGCGQYAPDAQGLGAKVPASWGDPHYTLRTADATLIHDKDGTRTDDDALERRVRDLRAGLGDFTGEGATAEVPDDVEARLEHLGYR
ncbi:sulfatase-like hydrolase/transferase [Halococcoides cellulosivorans]|uniref:Sulfatase N-terminal domain-containing protein n=1 Tax=Halococcoides cellulosivorans TaxID=1679096 RepID=A0A2R4X301_9EURY|nr:sulfatase-like hydrolase/transferase [Halococcoides cellulosivorans]AWB28167.1 hypothetical protein HARCEL1_10850 [Halococcoides cellulosivorans]